MRGPIIISDKSFIEMLSLDESTWLDQFFSNNITPILYIETLDDLKKPRKRISKENLVSEIAHKTPERNVYPNIFHTELVILDLCIQKIPMVQKPVIRAGIIKNIELNKTDMHIKSFPEIEVQQRWQELDFNEVERIIAGENILDSEFELDKWLAIANNILDGRRLKSLEEIRDFVNSFINNRGEEFFLLMLEMFNIPSDISKNLLGIYRQAGKPPLCKFAPYAAYVFKIKLFLYLSLQCKIPGIDISYKKDILYLLYLPFCQVFVSSDKSHHRMVPLFIGDNQIYIKGDILKKSITELNDHYLQYIDEINKQGIMQFAPFPPELHNNEVIKLWDKFCPGWRNLKTAKEEGDNTSIIDRIKKIKAASSSTDIPKQNSDFDSILIQRKASRFHGRWRILP